MLIFTLLNKKMNKNIKYTNNPNNKAKSRIIFDSKEVSSDKDSLSQEGLYFNFKIDKIVDTQYHMLIVGPNDSPYSGGYYMFDCQFPDLYPFFPMKLGGEEAFVFEGRLIQVSPGDPLSYDFFVL